MLIFDNSPVDINLFEKPSYCIAVANGIRVKLSSTSLLRPFTSGYSAIVNLIFVNWATHIRQMVS